MSRLAFFSLHRCVCNFRVPKVMVRESCPLTMIDCRRITIYPPIILSRERWQRNDLESNNRTASDISRRKHFWIGEAHRYALGMCDGRLSFWVSSEERRTMPPPLASTHSSAAIKYCFHKEKTLMHFWHVSLKSFRDHYYYNSYLWRWMASKSCSFARRRQHYPSIHFWLLIIYLLFK